MIKIKGIPYWGKSTFEDIRDVREREAELDWREYKSIEELITKLIARNVVIEVEGFYAYARDIRFNYRDRVIVLPYWYYEESVEGYKTEDERHLDYIGEGLVNIRYNFHTRMHLIENRETGYRVENITYYDYETKEKAKVELKGLKWTREKEIDLKRMYTLYEDASYYFIDDLDYDLENRYHRVGSEQGNNKEFTLRRRFGLPHYYQGTLGYAILSYRDYRMVEYRDHRAYLEHTEGRKAYWERKILFEMYLYCVMAEGIEPEERVEEFRELGERKREFKISGKGNPFYIKHYYKDKTKLRRKSYENYISVTKEQEKEIKMETK